MSSEDDTSIVVNTNLVGAYNADNVMAALAVGAHFGVSLEDAVKAIEAYVPSNNRSQMVRTKFNTLIVDAYNANPTSMEAALKNFASLQADHKAALLGDMLELGDHAPAEHRKLGELAAQKAELILCYGPNAPYVVEGSGGKAIAFDDRDAMTAALKEMAQSGDVILFKGSHGMHLELVLEAFLKNET